MTSIESTGFPLAFKVAGGSRTADSPTIVVDTAVRALDGMQKEALVRYGPDSAVWRLACDEGPYLNGRDMAPFPLGFFSAGMQFCFLSQLLQGARARGIPLDEVSLSEDNYYTMEGSFLRGDARGGARPAGLRLQVSSSADASDISALARMAERSSPAQALMRSVLANTFSLKRNGATVRTRLDASPSSVVEDPEMRFAGVAPGGAEFLPDIITRVKEAETVHGVDGGAGSSLKEEQKRTLHVHGNARWRGEMSLEATIDLHKPIGSSFRFLCDETTAAGGNALAPPPLVYLSAGIGFCFMTQLGRYAQIKKRGLRSYGVVQRTQFPVAGDFVDGTRTAGARPVDTHVFIRDDDGNDAQAADLIETGQRTCFLHAASGAALPSVVTVELNGETLGG